MWAQEMSAEEVAATGVAPGLVRLAVGLESEADLIADIEQALA
jgi:cystathionine beta-lyase/cystathionine gamma-synthase